MITSSLPMNYEHKCIKSLAIVLWDDMVTIDIDLDYASSRRYRCYIITIPIQWRIHALI